MLNNGLTVERNLSRWRISAYECEVSKNGNPTEQKGYVIGWYGEFKPSRLENEIIPKLAEYATQGRFYPFLITSHQLEKEATVHFMKEKIRRASDMKFSRRQKKSKQTPIAVVFSKTRYKILSPTS